MMNSPTDREKSSSALNPTVKKLGAVSFFADVASEMLYPITTLFLTTVLGASMTSLGAIEGTAEAIANLLKVYSGRWSDRVSKRKHFVVIGYFLSAISKPLIGMSMSWIQVFFARGLDRTGKGLRSAPRDALIAESVDENQRGVAFGWHRGMDTLGAALGPLITILLLNFWDGIDFRQLFWWALIPALISVAIALFVKDVSKEIRTPSVDPSRWSFKDFNPNLKRYFIAWTVFSLANSSDAFLLMKAKEAGFSTTFVVLFYCAYNLTYSLSSPYLGKLSDSMPRKLLIRGGLIIYSIVYLGFAHSTEAWHFWSLFLLYGLYMGATDGVGKALVVDLCPPDMKSTALGFFGGATGLATILASLTAGLIWDHFGSSFTFYFGAVGATAAVIIMSKGARP